MSRYSERQNAQSARKIFLLRELQERLSVAELSDAERDCSFARRQQEEAEAECTEAEDLWRRTLQGPVNLDMVGWAASTVERQHAALGTANAQRESAELKLGRKQTERAQARLAREVADSLRGSAQRSFARAGAKDADRNAEDISTWRRIRP